MSNRDYPMKPYPAIFGEEAGSGGQRTARKYARSLFRDSTLQPFNPSTLHGGKASRQFRVVALGKNQVLNQDGNLTTLTQDFRRELVRWNTHFPIEQFPRATAAAVVRITNTTCLGSPWEWLPPGQQKQERN
jgi:hypothetical protein